MREDEVELVESFSDFIPPELRGLAWRAHPLDGKLLLFERDQGLNLLLEGEETTSLRRVAPRTLLVAVTNACNLTCAFCYRDLVSDSLWRYDTLMQLCREADEWGVLEVAFGGGEPTIFPRWGEFVRELYQTTRLAINFTTNGLRLSDTLLDEIAGCYGQIRLSMYDDNDWATTILRLVARRARFGVNWLITPAELPRLAVKLQRLLALGVRDFLLLSYKGDDPTLHLDAEGCRHLGAFVTQAHQQFGARICLKVDVCWGAALPGVPLLFEQDDCGAHDDFISITSDRRVKPCSFHHLRYPFTTLEDIKTLWNQQRASRVAAHSPGCARLLHRRLADSGAGSNAIIPLAAVQ